MQPKEGLIYSAARFWFPSRHFLFLINPSFGRRLSYFLLQLTHRLWTIITMCYIKLYIFFIQNIRGCALARKYKAYYKRNCVLKIARDHHGQGAKFHCNNHTYIGRPVFFFSKQHSIEGSIRLDMMCASTVYVLPEDVHVQYILSTQWYAWLSARHISVMR